MNRHGETEPADDDRRLTVPVTRRCYARSVVFQAGRPGLVIDYGGAGLEFEMDDPEDAHEFAVVLAYAALVFGSQCRYLGGRHG
ncbi:MAG: hypothetical protein GEV28_31695 [Actinophytocola sp.]|uniref:hypothetical protein n=1 Tax=Actinophytocola sp. TaxID=1872138 RepID=UPI0013291FDB|nr:hypothetical protein [Actinophytocola sp.]MPZ84702.1 hypothetical protein [Actinophytocola sp.]